MGSTSRNSARGVSRPIKGRRLYKAVCSEGPRLFCFKSPTRTQPKNRNNTAGTTTACLIIVVCGTAYDGGLWLAGTSRLAMPSNHRDWDQARSSGAGYFWQIVRLLCYILRFPLFEQMDNLSNKQRLARSLRQKVWATNTLFAALFKFYNF
jgi:hypothetical protein